MDTFDWRKPTISLPDRLAQLAREAPDADAVRDFAHTLSRGELERATNGVANAILSERGADSEVVAFFAGVDARAIVSALGVMKAGKAYACLLDTFPPAQLAELLDDAEAAIVLTDVEHADLARAVAGPQRRVLVVDDIAPADRAPEISVHVDALATLIYTSGSTGKSKGVMHTHATLINDAGRLAERSPAQPGDCRTTFRSLTWLGATRELVGQLMYGGCLAPYDLRAHGINALPNWLREKRITVVNGINGLRQFWQTFPNERFPLVREVGLGGQTLYRRDLDDARRFFPNATVNCGMGISEAGIVTGFLIQRDDVIEHEVLPVGFPAETVRVWLLDEDERPITPGEVGEIVVQSDYLARGYWRRPDLTAQRFRALPQLGVACAYFTGDLGRFMPNGLLQHVGRKDFAVKIHGYKVPLDEIEAHLLGCDGVREACVVAYELGDGNQQLVAYLVTDGTFDVAIADVQARLAAHMPDYMLPRRFVFLDAMPKTHNGKIDRRALPSATHERPALAHPPTPPRTQAEREVAQIWEDVLGINGVGVHDGFLELGGDSLQAMQIVSRVSKAFGSDLSVRALFSAPTVAEMAARVEPAASTLPQ